jgi:hypothetical protein
MNAANDVSRFLNFCYSAVEGKLFFAGKHSGLFAHFAFAGGGHAFALI